MKGRDRTIAQKNADGRDDETERIASIPDSTVRGIIGKERGENERQLEAN